jgi:hypothetical protein
MSLCPNNTSGVLWRVFHLSPAQRQALFFGVCVPLRLAAAYAAFHYPSLLPLLVVVAAASVVKLATDHNQNQDQWWSKTWELLVAAAMVLSFFINPRLTPGILVVGVVGGVVQALKHGFC